MQKINIYKLPEQSKYKVVYVDVVHRCNMECANCYLPNRDFPDMDTERLKDIISRFPRRTEFRFIGGEPTLHKDLPGIINYTVSLPLKHKTLVATNGLRVAHRSYAEELRAAGLHSIYISMNGADDDDVYEVMDNLRCAHKKVEALKNCAELGLKLGIGCILVKGLNEHVPSRIKKLLNDFGIKAASLEFRNIGQIGRYMENKTFSIDEILYQLAPIYGFDPTSKEWKDSLLDNDEYGYYFPVDNLDKDRSHYSRMNDTLLIHVTDWDSMSKGFTEEMNKRRGRITEDFMVAPYFENLKENEGGF